MRKDQNGCGKIRLEIGNGMKAFKRIAKAGHHREEKTERVCILRGASVLFQLCRAAQGKQHGGKEEHGKHAV